MNSFEKNKHLIFAAVGILVTICGIVLTILAVVESRKAEAVIDEDTNSRIEE